MDDSTPEEDAVMSDHFAYLKGLLDEGTLILAGPSLDPVFGLIIFEADDEDAARRVLAGDPSIASGLQTAELHPFRASLTRSTWVQPKPGSDHLEGG
jgi:uncharacterized protein